MAKKIKTKKNNTPKVSATPNKLQAIPNIRVDKKAVQTPRRARELAVDPNVVEDAMAPSYSLKDAAIAAAKTLSLSRHDTTILESLSGVSSPSGDFVASNAGLNELLSKAELSHFLAIANTDPPVDIALVTLDVGSTTLGAAEVHLDADRPNIARMMGKMGDGNYYAKFVVKTDAPGSEIIKIGIVGVLFGAGIRKKAEAELTELKSKARSRLAREIQLTWMADHPDVLATFIRDSARVPEAKASKRAGKALTKKGKRKVPGKRAASQALQAFCLMSLLDRKAMIVAGGKGKDIKAAVVKAASDGLKLARKGPLPLHPDAVPHFWVTLADKIGHDRLRLPLITQRAVPTGSRRRASAAAPKPRL